MQIMNRYTTIRYHIFKELSKHREKQKERGTDRIIEFAIPILSGLIVQIFARRWDGFIRSCSCGSFILTLVGLVLLFIIIAALLKLVSIVINDYIKPFFCPFGFKKRITNDKLESAGARINYEVTYLVETAYNLAKKMESEDTIASKLSFQNVIFCLESADYKLNKSMRIINEEKKKAPSVSVSTTIGASKISSSMIDVILETYKATISVLESFSQKKGNLLSEELGKIKTLYESTEKEIKVLNK